MPVLPGGEIISGVGGRIWIDHNPESSTRLPNGYETYEDLNGLDPKNSADPEYLNYFLDISQWSITRALILAEVPHSGCAGGVTRRVIGQTWRFSASLPLDQSNFPDDRFAIGEIGIAKGSTDGPAVGDVSIAFYLGAVDINPEAIFMNMFEQRFYYSPRALIHQVSPVLNATGDVIRYNIAGEESCRLFLIPNESETCDRYMTYLNKHKGWL